MLKILGAAAVALIGSFVFFYKRGQKDFFDKKNVDKLSYEDILNDVREYLSKNKKNVGKQMSIQLLVNEAVTDLKSFLKNSNIDFPISGDNHLALMLLVESKPIYVCVYTYQELSDDLVDVFAGYNIFKQEID